MPVEDQNVVSYLWSVYDGSAAVEIKSRKAELQKDEARVKKLYQRMKNLDAEEKRKAVPLYQSAKASLSDRKVKLNKIIEDYSEIADKMEAASLGMVEPPRISTLSGLGVVQIPIGIVIVTLAVSATIIALVYGIIELSRIYKGTEVSSKGIIDQFAGVVGEVRGSIDAGSGLLKTTAVLGLVGLGGYLIYTLVERPGKISRAASTTRALVRG